MKSSTNSLNGCKKGVGTTESYFDVGTYVMAKWRNEFEYLAEVLAHRQRHGNKVEYRLRYIWDRVMEWTSVTRLRKATQYEIDYVFKFCRDNNVSFSKPPEKLPKVEVNRLSDSVSETDDFHLGSKRVKIAPVNVKSEKQLDGKVEMSCKPRLTRNSSIAIDEKKPNILISTVDGSVEQDEMVYDKSTIQFSEACRKRRQLKRQAIEAELKTVNQCSFDNKPPKPEIIESSGELEQVILKISKVDQKLDVFESKLVSTQIDSNNNVKIEDQKAVSTFNNSKQSVNVNSEPCLALTDQSSSTHVVTTKADTTVPLKLTPPTVFPCPHCPRRLRNSKLLSIHLRNYHKNMCSKSVNFKSSQGYCKTSISEAIFRHTNSIPSTVHSGKQKYLLSCHRCGVCGVVDQSTPNIVQCNHCLRWFHQSCYQLSTDAFKSKCFLPSVVVCDGCRMVSGSGRKSRQNEWQVSGWDALAFLKNTNIDLPITSRKLISKIMYILEQTHQLHPLLVTGRNILNATVLPSIDYSYKQNAKNTSLDFNLFCKNGKSGYTEGGLYDLKASEDQVNKLYMELRGIAFGNVNELSSDINSFSLDCSHPWPIDEHSETIMNARSSESLACQPGDATYSIAAQELSGFLQEYDPDIIPEISNLAYDGLVDDNGVIPSQLDECDEIFKVARFVSTCDTPLSTPQHLHKFSNSQKINNHIYSPSVTPVKDARSLSVLSSLGHVDCNTLDKGVCDLASSNPNRLSSDEISNVISHLGSSALHEHSGFLYESSRSSVCGSTDHLEQTNGNEMISLSLPAPSIMSDLLKGSMTEDFPISNSLSRSQSLSKAYASSNCVVSECGLDMEWLEANTNHSNTNRLSNDLVTYHNLSSELVQSKAFHATPKTPRAMINIDSDDNKYAIDDELPSEHCDKLLHVQSELDYLDRFVVRPLENALDVMEAEVNSVTNHLGDLEQTFRLDDCHWSSSDDDNDDDTDLPSTLGDLLSKQNNLFGDASASSPSHSNVRYRNGYVRRKDDNDGGQVKDCLRPAKTALKKLYQLQMLDRVRSHNAVSPICSTAVISPSSVVKNNAKNDVIGLNTNHILGLGLCKTDANGLTTFSIP